MRLPLRTQGTYAATGGGGVGRRRPIRSSRETRSVCEIMWRQRMLGGLCTATAFPCGARTAPVAEVKKRAWVRVATGTLLRRVCPAGNRQWPVAEHSRVRSPRQARGNPRPPALIRRRSTPHSAATADNPKRARVSNEFVVRRARHPPFMGRIGRSDGSRCSIERLRHRACGTSCPIGAIPLRMPRLRWLVPGAGPRLLALLPSST